MWKLLYQLASPQKFYQLSAMWVKPLTVMTLCFLIIGVLCGLIFSPPDYQQGEAFRVIYVHVPSAFLSLSLYAWMAFLAVLLLVWRIKMAGIVLRATAHLGACMTFVALVTGSLWGKPMWGAWWVWDARLTSELILLFLYGAILAVGHAYQDKEQGDKLISILTLVGLIDLPIIHYSVYWWNTLHQGATLTLFTKPKIATNMLYPLLLILAGLLMYCLLLILLRSRTELVLRERQQSWVKRLAQEGRL